MDTKELTAVKVINNDLFIIYNNIHIYIILLKVIEKTIIK
jgi:hypothetical protein